MVNRNVQDLTNATAYDKNGDKLGSVKEVYINDATGQPDFVEVGHGLFGMSSSLVPLRGHRLDGEDLRLAFTKDRIEDAPNIDDDAHLSENDQDTIYRHYGIGGTENVETYDSDRRNWDRDDRDLRDDRTAAAGTAGAASTVGAAGTVADGFDARDDRDFVDADRNRTDRDVTDRDRDLTDGDSIVRSEERLNVDKDRVETGQARLRKYVVHDTETVEVPVEREEVRIERNPIDADDARAHRGGQLGDDEASVTLHEERVNVSKETVPVEEVRLDKQTVRDTENVREDVAHEEIDVDGAGRNVADRDRDLLDDKDRPVTDRDGRKNL